MKNSTYWAPFSKAHNWSFISCPAVCNQTLQSPTKHVSAFKLMEGTELTKVRLGCTGGYITGMSFSPFLVFASSSWTKPANRVQLMSRHSAAQSFPSLQQINNKTVRFWWLNVSDKWLHIVQKWLNNAAGCYLLF